jgi:hypothetical protein
MKERMQTNIRLGSQPWRGALLKLLYDRNLTRCCTVVQGCCARLR